MADIKLIRFVNGEEIVAEILSEDAVHIKVENACAISLAMDQGGKPNLSMQPWSIFSTDKVLDINKQHVMFVTSIDPKIEMKYNEIYGKIIMPKQNIII
jgi:hypothetical protein